jgi:hypothetical protein
MPRRGAIICLSVLLDMSRLCRACSVAHGDARGRAAGDQADLASWRCGCARLRVAADLVRQNFLQRFLGEDVGAELDALVAYRDGSGWAGDHRGHRTTGLAAERAHEFCGPIRGPTGSGMGP